MGDGMLKYMCLYSNACMGLSCCTDAEISSNGILIRSCSGAGQGDPCIGNGNKAGCYCSDGSGSFSVLAIIVLAFVQPYQLSKQLINHASFFEELLEAP